MSRVKFHFAEDWVAQLKSVGSDRTFPSRSGFIKPLIGFADHKRLGPSWGEVLFICHLYVNLAIMDIVPGIGLQPESAH
jgi:hypothetical protein